MSRPVITPLEEDIPFEGDWSFPTLYKQPARGGLRMWEVGFDGIDHLEIRYGVVDGAIQLDRTEIKLNKSKRSMQEQAFLEARSRYDRKFREGYEPRETMSDTASPTHTKAMKGVEYKEGMIEHWPVLTQPKLDGIRMVASLVGAQLKLLSWLNKPFLHLKHLEGEISQLLSLLPAGAVLDGELYSEKMNFQELTSVIKRVKSSHPRIGEVEYWIFDVDLPLPCEKRYELLQTTMKDKFHLLRLVPSQEAFSHADILKQHQGYVAQGYEGTMIKKTACGAPENDSRYAQSLYKGGRTQNILKHKDFVDEEVDIVGVQEAKGNQKGAVVFEVRDVRGNEFTVSMKGSLTQRREWFQHPELVIGKKLTIKYQELTNKGVPRFPVGVAVRDYE